MTSGAEQIVEPCELTALAVISPPSSARQFIITSERFLPFSTIWMRSARRSSSGRLLCSQVTAHGSSDSTAQSNVAFSPAVGNNNLKLNHQGKTKFQRFYIWLVVKIKFVNQRPSFPWQMAIVGLKRLNGMEEVGVKWRRWILRCAGLVKIPIKNENDQFLEFVFLCRETQKRNAVQVCVCVSIASSATL